jgi:hemerythrin-like domain-containing protein
MKATQQLRDEHEDIKLLLSIVERVINKLNNAEVLDIKYMEKIIDFIKGFADKCHHGKEEDVLFPALIKKGMSKDIGPIAVMLKEHQQGRVFVNALSKAFDDFKNGTSKALHEIVENALNYVNLLRSHIIKENDVLFMMADKLLSEIEQNEIAESFEKIEIEKIGLGKHLEYKNLLENLKLFYLG